MRSWFLYGAGFSLMFGWNWPQASFSFSRRSRHERHAMTLDTLQKIAQDAADEAEGDWFDPDLIESKKPILSTRPARRFIAAASPELMLRLIAVARAAEAVVASREAPMLGKTGAEVIRIAQDRMTAVDALRSALAELEDGK